MSLNNKNVLIITGVFKPEPVVSANLMADLAENLSKLYKVTVIRPKPSRPLGFKVPEFDYKKLPYEVITSISYVYPASKLFGRFRESVSMGRWCAKYIKKHHNEIDFVYIGSWQLFGRELIARAALKYGIPYITPVQDVYPESILSKLPQNKLLHSLVKTVLMPSDKFLLSHAERVHTISDNLVDYLSRTRNLPKEKFFVVRNWQDEERFTNYKKTPVNEDMPFSFMFLGSIGPLTGLDVVIKAFKKASLQNARLIIAGNGSAKNSLKELIKDLCIENIEFWDAPFEKVPEIQSKTDVLILSLRKGFGLTSVPSKLPAYMFSSKPVLASVDAESDTALCIKESDAGWVAKPEDVESIAEAMKIAYSSSKDELQEMGKRGFDYAIENFSKQKNLRKLADACISVIKR